MLLLMPEIILFATALVVLVYDLIKIRSSRVVLFGLAIFGLVLSFASLFLPFLSKYFTSVVFFSGFYVADPFSIFFKGLFLVIGLIVLLINYDFFSVNVRKNEGDFYFLFLLSILGLIMAASSPNLLMIYLAIELVSLTSYLLSGWQKNEARSCEAALKYFLFGAASSAILLYGISLFYGLTGTFTLSTLAAIGTTAPLSFIALLFIVLGLGFKIAMVPMQFWCPDVYEGAPTPITAYLSVGPKAMGLAVLLRFLILLRLDLTLLFAVISALTMTWGNIVAIRQRNIKRLLAYSSIAQAGYIMIGLVSPGIGYPTVVFYVLAYALANLGVFAAVIYLADLLSSEDIESYAGIATRSPSIAAAFTLFFLSLIGIPPLAGFVGKFLVFGAAVGSGFLWLAVAGVINSVVSVYYYLNVVRIMYFTKGQEARIRMPALISIVIWACLGATVILGIFPNLVFW